MDDLSGLDFSGRHLTEPQTHFGNDPVEVAPAPPRGHASVVPQYGNYFEEQEAKGVTILDQVIEDITNGWPPKASAMLARHAEHFTYPRWPGMNPDFPNEPVRYSSKNAAMVACRTVVDLACQVIANRRLAQDPESLVFDVALIVARYESVIGHVQRTLLATTNPDTMRTLATLFEEMSESMLAILGSPITKESTLTVQGAVEHRHGHIHGSLSQGGVINEVLGVTAPSLQSAYKNWRAGDLEIIDGGSQGA